MSVNRLDRLLYISIIGVPVILLSSVYFGSTIRSGIWDRFANMVATTDLAHDYFGVYEVVNEGKGGTVA